MPVLTFIPGTIAWPDNFHLLDSDGRLRRVARLICDFHDAVTGFRPPPDARWQALVPAEGTGLIAHHDLLAADPSSRRGARFWRI